MHGAHDPMSATPFGAPIAAFGSNPPPAPAYAPPASAYSAPPAYAAPASAYAPPPAPAYVAQSAPAPAPQPVYSAPIAAPAQQAPALPVATRKGGTEAVGVVGEVICPSCKMPTMASPGAASVCFSCGQPLDASRPAEGGRQAFPLTGAMPSALAPPVDPYASSGPRLRGEGVDFPVSAAEAGVGRDPARCKVILAEPRVSGVHAYVKLEGGLVYVKDEGSNNGTFVDGARIAPHLWVPVRVGVELRFGPVAFTVTP